ncbi:MAG: BrnT family toxin [Ignavibacteria bacterium]|nr:BrnT family toxin [Ignavibacteria bacterium]
MQLFPQFIGFDWDEGNRLKNWRRHKVAWWECEEVFFNQPLYVFQDQRHSLAEERSYLLGKTHINRLLFIVFTRRSSWIRVISARDMSGKERKVYLEKAKKDTKV